MENPFEFSPCFTFGRERPVRNMITKLGKRLRLIEADQ
jgi:hypothetical protein